MQDRLNHLLERSAQTSPDKGAVLFKDRALTYGNLDRTANRVANLLLANGVKPGDRVGIFLSKSLWSIVSIHAIHKAGAAYVPLDPDAPAKRVSSIIVSAGIRCLLTDADRANRALQEDSARESLTTLVLTDENPAEVEFQGTVVRLLEVLDGLDDNRPTQPQIGSDLAYILYTSGSTGIPKGVAISHLNALNFVNWASDAFSVTAEDVLSNHAPYHFDLSILDVFAAMKTGASLVLVPAEYSSFPYRLAEWIDQQSITIWYSVPSILSMMLRHGGLERFDFRHLRTILFAGEVFPVKHLRDLMEKLPHVDYYNLYGPTETNVITYWHVEQLAENRVEPIPIGQACANTELFVVNLDGQVITDTGVEGELYARGPSVAQGYWGDSESTRKVFLDDFGHAPPGDNVYRTGDIVKLCSDANFDFIGRRDDMVKSRGYRIELGEIEAVIYNHPRVTDVAVVAVSDEEVGCRIKAFVVIRDEDQVDGNEIRAHCANYLAKYMVPETVKIRSALPKTSTGKVDKTALKAGR